MFVIGDANRARKSRPLSYFLAKQILELRIANVIEITVEEGYYGPRGYKLAFLLNFGVTKVE